MSSAHRAAILAAATEIFARFGFKKASIDDIARRAGVGKGTVYLHFESKEELFGATVRHIAVKGVGDLEAVVEEARTPQAKVRAFLERRQRQQMQLAADLGISAESLLELLAYAAPHRPEPRAREAALLEKLIREGNAQGAFAVRSPELVAAGVSACLQGLDACLVGPGGLEVQDALDEIRDVFLRGLLAGAPQTGASELTLTRRVTGRSE